GILTVFAYSYLKSESFDLPDNKTDKINIDSREFMITDDTMHSIPLDEILSGGPPKDGIPSIDEPKFISTSEADEFLKDDEIGLGLFYKDEARFYPFQVMVWHEIVNDKIQGEPILVTYCPLCFTGIVFESKVNGEAQEFGVSGKLWKSNLLMYNRTGDPNTESLWSQVLGEAVVGPETGTKLKIIPSDIVRYSDWKNKYRDTKVLSRDTGHSRSYGRDPYGGYYTSDSFIFNPGFEDERLHPKEFVVGIEVDGKFKAYKADVVKEGVTEDSVGGVGVKIEKSSVGEFKFTKDDSGEIIPHINAFWFSWVSVHPETELFK
ncbi:MAG: DUF3179 domain-containing protein, partial [Candidatus Spechtbacterales bacterium]